MSKSTVVLVFLCVFYCVAVMGLPIDFDTEDIVKYKFFPYSNTSIHFKVKAANDVHIGLTMGPVETEPMVEVVIGVLQNTNSVIRRRFRTIAEKFTAETPSFLSAGEFRGFWVSWDGGVISVGREGEDEPFMYWKDPQPFPVSYIGFHTGYGASGSWKIEDPPAKSLAAPTCGIAPRSIPREFITEDNLIYKFFAYSNTYLHFKVKAGNDAHIGLTTGPQESDPMIEIAIGGWSNTNSVIRRRFKKLPDKVTAETPGILSGSEYRGFWIHWDCGDIAVGRKGECEPFMAWKDPEPFHVSYLGFHTGHGSTGHWIIEDICTSSAPEAPTAIQL